jgi:hypothetical protein
MENRLGCLGAFFQLVFRLLGIGARGVRSTTEPLEKRYREFVDTWASENLARWLHETRAEIKQENALDVLLHGPDVNHEAAASIRETLIDAKVTFSQREGKQYLEIEAYMAPRQLNGKVPSLLRWHAEREINWQEIPDDVREQLIRQRQPITLGYTIPV